MILKRMFLQERWEGIFTLLCALCIMTFNYLRQIWRNLSEIAQPQSQMVLQVTTSLSSTLRYARSF